MKYRSSTEGREIVEKDYRKKIIFSPDDFDEKDHLLEVVTIHILGGEAIITINALDYPVKPGEDSHWLE